MKALAALAVLALSLVACQQPTEQIDIQATVDAAVKIAMEAIPTPTPTATATPTPKPTATPTPTYCEWYPSYCLTATPQPTPMSTPSPSSTPFVPRSIVPTPELIEIPTPISPPILVQVTPVPPVTAPIDTFTPVPTPITENRIIVDRRAWDCFIDHSCSGFEDDRVLKWFDNNINVYSEGRYQNELREVLDYLGPILNLNFDYVSDDNTADLIALVGIDRSSRSARGLFEEYCWDFAGCGGIGSYSLSDYEITEGNIVVWFDSDDGATEIKHVIIHEALHALTGVDHSRRLDFIIEGCHGNWAMNCTGSALRLPYMLPLEEAIYELWAHPLIAAGDIYDEIVPRLVFVSADMSYNLEPLIEAYKLLTTVSKFEYTTTHYEQGCEHYDKQVEVTVNGLDEYGDLDFVASVSNNQDSYSTNFFVAYLLAEVIRSGAVVTKKDNGYYASMTTNHLYDGDTGRDGYKVSFLIDEQFRIRSVLESAEYAGDYCDREKRASNFIYR